MSFLSDESVQAHEDPADRCHPEAMTVQYERQEMTRHSWEDCRRRTIEKSAFKIIEQVSKPGTHHLDAASFKMLADFLWMDEPGKLRKALKSGRVDLKSSLVLRLLP
jgi:hypothetical protein